MKKIFFGLHVCAVFAAAGFVLHCSSTDTRPDAGSTDVTPDGGGGTSSGQQPAGELLAEPADVYFGENGLVNCGTAAAPQTVTFTNNSNGSRQFKTKLTAGGEYYTLSPDVVTVSPGSKGTMQILPKTLPAKSSVAPELYSGSLEVTVVEGGSANSAGTTLTNLRLHMTARGAVVKTTLAAAAALNFGGVKIGTTSNQTFSLTNTGNAPIELGFAIGSPAFNVDPKTSTLAANGTGVTTVSFTPAAQQAYNDALVISNPKGAPLCDDLPGQTALTATGTLSVGTAPGSLAFGLVDCGTTTPFKTVTITNDGAAMQFTATLAKGGASPYTLADNAGTAIAQNQQVSVNAASTFVLRVVPKQVTPPVLTNVDGLGDTLTITTNSPGDAPHVVQLTQTARGAFLKLDKAQYQVKDGQLGHTLGTNITLSNTGNLAVPNYSIDVAGRAGVPAGTFKLLKTSGSLASPQDQVIVLETLTPTSNWTPPAQLIGDITVSAPGVVLCSDAQPTAPVYLEP